MNTNHAFFSIINGNENKNDNNNKNDNKTVDCILDMVISRWPPARQQQIMRTMTINLVNRLLLRFMFMFF